jgi:hypothetical protein
LLSRAMSLTRISGGLLLVAAVCFLFIGVTAFFLPTWASGEFPWAVGPFLAQTIGGWSIGTALICVHAVWAGQAARIYPLRVYAWLFGIGQMVVVIAFLDKLQTGHLLTYPYLVGLVALIGSCVAGVGAYLSDRAPRRVEIRPVGEPVPAWAKVFGALVGLFVLFLAIGALISGPDGATARGQVFPEPMGLFSMRAFSAFLFAIVGLIVAALLSRGLDPFIALGWAGLYLVVPITLAALLNLSLFTFSFSHPGNAIYLLAYVVIGVVIAVVLYRYREHSAFDRG